jgi:hypothetical protein
MNAELQSQANRLKKISLELEAAMKHAIIGAEHFNSAEVPRACAQPMISII